MRTTSLLLGVLGEWAEVLEAAAVQQLSQTLLEAHIAPHLTAALARAADDKEAKAWAYVLGAAERAALSLPKAWRKEGKGVAALSGIVDALAKQPAAAEAEGSRRLSELRGALG